MTDLSEEFTRIQGRYRGQLDRGDLPDAVVTAVDAVTPALDYAIFRQESRDAYEQHVRQTIEDAAAAHTRGDRSRPTCTCRRPDCPLKPRGGATLPPRLRGATDMDRAIDKYIDGHRSGDPLVLREARRDHRQRERELRRALATLEQMIDHGEVRPFETEMVSLPDAVGSDADEQVVSDA